MNNDPRTVSAEDTARLLKAAAGLGVLGSGTLSAPSLLSALCNPDVTMDELAALLEQEPGLTIRVLRVANSAFYGGSRSVKSLDRALVVLGLDAVRGIAAAACLDRTVMHAPELACLDRPAFVRHSLATAVSAEALARLHQPRMAGEAFIGGLLHNLGVLLQTTLNPAGAKTLIAALHSKADQDIRALEVQCQLLSHEQCGAVMFEAWHLPASLVAAAGHHHAMLPAPHVHRQLAGLVQLGARCAVTSGHGFPMEPLAVEPDAATMALLGLTEDDLAGVAIGLAARMSVLQQCLSDL